MESARGLWDRNQFQPRSERTIEYLCVRVSLRVLRDGTTERESESAIANSERIKPSSSRSTRGLSSWRDSQRARSRATEREGRGKEKGTQNRRKGMKWCAANSVMPCDRSSAPLRHALYATRAPKRLTRCVSCTRTKLNEKIDDFYDEEKNNRSCSTIVIE